MSSLPGGRNESHPVLSGAHTGVTVGDGWLCSALVEQRGGCLHYLARDSGGKLADLLVLLPPDGSVPSERGLLDEIAMAGRLPVNVSPALIGHGKLEDGSPYLLHKRLIGCWLSDLMGPSRHPLDLPTGLDVAIQLAEALDACHRRDLIHRLVRPSTVFLTREGEVRLPPVGDASAPPCLWEPDAFTAPELLRDDESLTGPGVDVYSVGATLFAVLSGVAPLPAEPEQPESYDAVDRSVAFAAPWLPLGLIETIDRSLRGAPSRRFASAGELAAALRELLKEIDEAVDAPTDPRGTRRASLGAKVREAAEALDPFDRERKATALASAFEHLTIAWTSAKPYDTHGTSQQPIEAAWDCIAPLLAEFAEGLTVEVRPYGLYRRDLPIWLPERQLRTITNRLFAAGMRTLTLRPSLTPEEFERFAQFLGGIGRDGNKSPLGLTLAFDDARFAGVRGEMRVSLDRAWVLRDPTVEQELTELRDDVDEELEDDLWCRGQVGFRLLQLRSPSAVPGSDGGAEPPQSIRGGRSAYEQLGPPPGIGIAPRSLADVKTQVDSRDFSSRQGMTAASALLQAFEEGGSASVEMSWRAAVHNTQSNELALDYALDSIDSIPNALAPGLLTRLLDPATSRRLLVALTQTDRGQLIDQRVKTLVGSLSPEAFDAILAAYQDSFHTGLGAELRSQVQRLVVDERELVSAQIASMPANVALDVLSICRSKSADLTSVALGALTHVDLDVRVMAARDAFPDNATAVLPHVIGLLDSTDASVRSNALELLEQHRPSAAARAIFTRLQSSEGVTRSPGEHKRLLMLLFELSAAQGERYAMALVRTHGPLPDPELDSRRRVAVQLLGSHSGSAEALEAAELASGRWWWNTPELREAARIAVAAIKQRGAHK